MEENRQAAEEALNNWKITKRWVHTWVSGIHEPTTLNSGWGLLSGPERQLWHVTASYSIYYQKLLFSEVSNWTSSENNLYLKALGKTTVYSTLPGAVFIWGGSGWRCLSSRLLKRFVIRKCAASLNSYTDLEEMSSGTRRFATASRRWRRNRRCLAWNVRSAIGLGWLNGVGCACASVRLGGSVRSVNLPDWHWNGRYVWSQAIVMRCAVVVVLKAFFIVKSGLKTQKMAIYRG